MINRSSREAVVAAVVAAAAAAAVTASGGGGWVGLRQHIKNNSDPAEEVLPLPLQDHREHSDLQP